MVRAWGLVAAAYLAAIASLILFEPLMSGGGLFELAVLGLWALAVGGCFAASRKMGLIALPSALFALAWPLGLMIALSGGGLS